MNEWESKGRDNWRRNRKTRAYEIKRALDFEEREIRLFKQQLDKEMQFNTDDMNNGIADFHENMKK